jgi:L-ascorbate metabolism protein UlaG (beta-lactamase superfamily)
MMIFAVVIFVAVIVVYAFMKLPQFGKMPEGEQCKRIQNSTHFRDGSFQNLSITPNLAEGVGFFKVFKEFFFNKSKRSKPAERLPGKKTDLHTLAPGKNVLVWFGHSSYFMQVDGMKILVDPVFSGHASPVSFSTKSYPGADLYTPDDIPEIDYLFITHDHFDHLDYSTVNALRPKIKKVLTGLGTAAHLAYWGYDPSIITERDWNETIELGNGFTVHTLPARHFSGRTFKRNQSLWMSFALFTPSLKIYIGGDSGYDTHFAEIGNTFGPFDLAILECGQYNPYWKYIHMLPEEIPQAAIDLKATKLLPVHWAKFSLSLHSWDEPIIRVMKESKLKQVPVLHPMIGEEANLSGDNHFTNWWETLR